MISPNPRVTRIESDGGVTSERERVRRAQSKGNESFMEMSGEECDVGDRRERERERKSNRERERERESGGQNFYRAAATTTTMRPTCRGVGEGVKWRYAPQHSRDTLLCSRFNWRTLEQFGNRG